MCDACLNAIRPNDRKIEVSQPAAHWINVSTPAFDPSAPGRYISPWDAGVMWVTSEVVKFVELRKHAKTQK